ncbi:MAG TPA: dockerin type I domain-containing protein [Pseudobacteroides sp.]
MADVIIIAGYFNQSSQSNIKCDLNNDGVINISDIIILAKKFNTVFS